MLLKRGADRELAGAPDFKESEFFSKDSFFRGETHGIDDELIVGAQVFRNWCQSPVTINSSYRTPAKQRILTDGSRGAKSSEHVSEKDGQPWTHAIDVDAEQSDIDRAAEDLNSQGPLFQELMAAGIRRFGIYNGFLHFGTGKKPSPMSSSFNGVPFQIWDYSSRTYQKKSAVDQVKDWAKQTLTDEDGAKGAEVAGVRPGIGPIGFIAIPIAAFVVWKITRWIFKKMG